MRRPSQNKVDELHLLVSCPPGYSTGDPLCGREMRTVCASDGTRARAGVLPLALGFILSARGVCRSRSMHGLPTLSSVAVAGVARTTGGVPPSLITPTVPGTHRSRSALKEVYGGPPLTPQAGQRCARMASAFTSQVRNYRATARARRRRAPLLRGRRGSRLGGIPWFSAAVSETQSCVVSAETAATPRLGVGIRFLDQLDHDGGLGREVAARHWPQFRQIVVPIAGSVVGHRIAGMLPRPSAAQATCSVTWAQPEQ